jgi:hypothetical protein
VAPEWVHARITRAEARPFGGGRIGFRFELADDVESARARRWRDAWASVAANAATAARAYEVDEIDGVEEPAAV